jgi:hypothetical protein
VIFMVYGHTIDALLAPEYRFGRWFDVWQFQRGLTSVLFLLMAGFVFSVVTSRRWESHVRPSPALARRLLRFTIFVALGYLIHFPAASLGGLADVTDAQWRAFAAVDVLQLIGVSLLVLQGLVLVARTRERFAGISLLLGLGVVGVTPLVWRSGWVGDAPLVVAAYLWREPGSLFPFFPWAGYVLAGAAIGQVYAGWHAGLERFATRVLLGGGAACLAAWLVVDLAGIAPIAGVSASGQPTLFALRAGASLVFLGGLAHLSRVVARVPWTVSAVAQESLLIYVVHLCMVYGSAWNPGLRQIVGGNQSPLMTLVAVATVLVTVIPVAWAWHWLSHWRPLVARRIAAGVAAALLIALL